MLRDRYAAVDLFALALALAFEPVLARLDALLDDDALFGAVRADLARRRPKTSDTGRPSAPVGVVRRLLVVRRLYGWSDAGTERFVTDSIVLRRFCRLGLARAPDDTTLLRWADLVRPRTLAALLDHVVGLARRLRVTRGRTLRVDSTVVATTIHHPTDPSLLVDGVRVLGRLLRRARPLAGDALAGVRDAFRTRTRAARRQLRRIHRPTRRVGEAAAEEQRAASARLCAIAGRVLGQAARVRVALAGRGPAAERAAGELARVLPLVHRVVDQAERRVLRGGQVPAAEKVVSLVEPHTAVVTRHKAGQAVAFGRTLWLAEADGGIVTDARVLDGAPPEPPPIAPTLARHRRQFGRAPHLLAGDRGCASAPARRDAAAAGVCRVVPPHTGAPTAASRARERQRWFRRGDRWRAGVEGRIGVLQRVHGLDRCPDHGDAGLRRWVGWGVLTANLLTIARATAA